MKRSELKNIHENSVLIAYKKYHEALGNSVEILSRPEPPDAIVKLNDVKNWIEITDAFISSTHAKSITSKITIDKEWIESMPKVIDISDFKETLRAVIQEKYDKKSIRKVYKRLGEGILIVGCFSPFFYPIKENIEELSKLINDVFTSNKKIFKEIYLYDYDFEPIQIV